ncbi:pentatricopeptide repeat-containing protein at3g49240-like protein [Trifolium pratense]|uniref:Pentatricopeptide repeat-containing protein at3g49240-like protein n=1 Tax=Trifolium pratense TaxID=57577 RepID=A0A2K3LCV7_TRIPR|nr:pentatricopeptide repeat-containing protein at3g49240-like protein [Trifolium pratense]
MGEETTLEEGDDLFSPLTLFGRGTKLASLEDSLWKEYSENLHQEEAYWIHKAESKSFKHNPPAKLVVNLGSFNVMVDGYCVEGRFKEEFRFLGAWEVYGEMEGKGVNPEEYTYGLLMDTCFKESQPYDAASYFRKMVELRKEGREEDLTKLMEEKERLKAEAKAK